MKIKWFGLVSFLVTSEKGTRLIIDPYVSPDENIPNAPIEEEADIVAMTHGHFAHSYIFTIQGSPQLYTGPDVFKKNDILLRCVPTYHSGNNGKVNILCAEIDNINICHLGDVSYHLLEEKIIGEIGKVDLLLIPLHSCDKSMTVEDIGKIISALNPKVVITMHHFADDKLNDFLDTNDFIKQPDSSELVYSAQDLPPSREIYALKPAL